jgi:hypothetical protein
MGILRLAADLAARAARAGDGASPHVEDGRPDSLALPRFLEVRKTIPLTHAEISALYFVVEDYFEAEIEGADPEGHVDEARALALLLRDVIRRWDEAEPTGIYADLIELPWHS